MQQTVRPKFGRHSKHGTYPKKESAYAHTITAAAAADKYNVNIDVGLPQKECANRLKIHGKNKLAEKKRGNILLKFLEQFADVMIVILLIAAAISFWTAIHESDSQAFLDPIIILVIVIVNAITGVVQEFKAEKAIDALKSFSVAESIVFRDGRKQKINSEDLVPGDVIFLDSGCKVPADARIYSSSSLFADESALTGESVPTEKNAAAVYSAATPLGDRKNMVYMSSLITGGKCTAIITDTGMNTEVGRIAELLSENHESATPLQKKLAKTGKILAVVALGVCAVIFILGLLQNVPFIDMFMLSISLAVAAIPASVK